MNWEMLILICIMKWEMFTVKYVYELGGGNIYICLHTRNVEHYLMNYKMFAVLWLTTGNVYIYICSGIRRPLLEFVNWKMLTC